MNASFALLSAGILLVAVPAAGQLVPAISLPQVPVLEPVTESVEQTLERPLETVQSAGEMLQARAQRIADFLTDRRKFVEPDAEGQPAVRGELLLLDPDAATRAAARDAGFAEASTDQLGALGMSVIRLQVPRGMSLAGAQRALLRAAPNAEIAPDNLHFQSGGTGIETAAVAGAVGAASAIAAPVGVIDGAPGKGEAVAALRGFAKGAPVASNHGSAVVSLLQGAGVQRVLAADVYGHDPAGGNSLAIVRALDWLAGSGARVVSISLVGPRNAVLEKAIGAVRGRGVVVVAAVGNDGPAAPPAYPASYLGVLAVTGVDGRQRPLIEAGHALHLDYAAPGAGIRGRNKDGGWTSLRGTSFAVPLVAARAAAALERDGSWQATLDREAVDLGPRGPDSQFGRGLLCAKCVAR
jgi:hypothetical protein